MAIDAFYARCVCERVRARHLAAFTVRNKQRDSCDDNNNDNDNDNEDEHIEAEEKK